MPSTTPPAFPGYLSSERKSGSSTPIDTAIAADNSTAAPGSAQQRALYTEHEGGFSNSDILRGIMSTVLHDAEDDADDDCDAAIDDGRTTMHSENSHGAPRSAGGSLSTVAAAPTVHSTQGNEGDTAVAAATVTGAGYFHVSSGDERTAAAEGTSSPLPIHAFPTVLAAPEIVSGACSPPAMGRSTGSSGGPRAASASPAAINGNHPNSNIASNNSNSNSASAATNTQPLGRPPAYASVTSMATSTSGIFPQFSNASTTTSTAGASHWGSLAGVPAGATMVVSPTGGLVTVPQAAVANSGISAGATAASATGLPAGLFPVSPGRPPHTLAPPTYPHRTPVMAAAAALPLGFAAGTATAVPSAVTGLPASKSGDMLSDEQVKSNLFVCNLPLSVTDKDLRTVFGEYGHIESAKVMLNIHSGESRGIAFVKFSDSSSADRALRALNDTTAFGGTQLLIVRVANSKAAYLPGAPTNKTFVRNVPVELSKQDLTEFFETFGTVVDISIHADTAGENAAAGAAALMLPGARPVSTSAEGSGPSASPSSGGADGTSDGDRKLNIVFVTFAEKESAQRAADAIHTTTPFRQCRGVPLLAKVAEDNARRIERLHRKYNRGGNSTGMNGNTSLSGFGGASTTLPMMGASLSGTGMPSFTSFPNSSAHSALLAAGGAGGMPVAGYYSDPSATALYGSSFPGAAAAATAPLVLPQLNASSFMMANSAPPFMTSSPSLTSGMASSSTTATAAAPPSVLSMSMPMDNNSLTAFYIALQQQQQQQALLGAPMAARSGQSLGGTHLSQAASSAPSMSLMSPPQSTVGTGAQQATAAAMGNAATHFPLSVEQQHSYSLQLLLQQQHQQQLQMLLQQQLQQQQQLQHQQQQHHLHSAPPSAPGFGALPGYAAYAQSVQQPTMHA